MEERRNDHSDPHPGINRPYPIQGTAAGPLSPPEQARVPGREGFKPLGKEEREEAARIALEAGFSFEGYQVVRREFFSHRFDPTLTIKGNSITFNNSCISKLEQVVYVQILVNPTTEKLVIRPCEEGARDAIRWCVTRDDKRKSRQITCGLFTTKLYDMMGWEAVYRYKLQGTRINYQGEQLYVFDLTSTEAFLPQTKEVDEAGKPKRRRAAPMYPANWRDSSPGARGLHADQSSGRLWLHGWNVRRNRARADAHGNDRSGDGRGDKGMNGYEGYSWPTREPLTLTLCLEEDSILLNQAVLEALCAPRQVQMLINEERRMLLVQACAMEDREAIVVPATRASQFEMSGHALLKRIRRLTGWMDERPRVVYGTHIASHHAVVFDLSSAQPALPRMPRDSGGAEPVEEDDWNGHG